ncbi:Threonine aldolase, partial [Kappamyces sp. JEL0680]
MYSHAAAGAAKVLADYRSDTVTKPTPEMLAAMTSALVGDDVFSDDPTVKELEERVAALAGKEAGLFCSSGTLSNQLAIRTHLKQPPYSVLCDKRAHVNSYEAGGIAFHCGAAVITAQPNPGKDYLTADVIQREMILDDDIHHAPTALVCLENTMNGQVFPLEEQQKIGQLVHDSGVLLHLDGARVWNAMTATG